MSVYAVALVTIHDREEYRKYQEGFIALFSQYDAEIVVASEDVEILEGEWPYTRTVIVRFANREEARRWYESDEYRKVAQHRFRSAHAHVALMEGRA